MCGICGIVRYDNGEVDSKDIQLMMKKMKHRGPDDNGIFIKNNVGLGFVRLSILDLSIAGHQPMFSESGRFVIVFNGEVYNYIELRNELKHKYSFKTETDTEVVLAAYQEWKEDCLHRFNGMFSFVIYDIENYELFGARDRFGIKPFYFFNNFQHFVFGSEIKSLLPVMGYKEPNNELIQDYLLFNRTDHTNNSFFRGVQKVPHGTCFRMKNGAIKFSKWYSLEEQIQGKDKIISPQEYRELFKDSLRLRLRADVPIGVTLSGGIDSSSIVSSLVKDFDIKDLYTFSAVYGKGEISDESNFIEAFNGMLKNMNFTKPNAEMFYDEFEEFIYTHNEPMPDTSPYVQFKVMDLASKHVKVTLDGQGADEQLAGYHYFFGSFFRELISTYKWTDLIKENYYYLNKHKSLNALRYFLFYNLPNSFQNYLMNEKYPSVNRNLGKVSSISSEINDLLYKPLNLRESLLQHFEYKLEHLLRYEDLNSMHFSIESRVPFLDYRLVEATMLSGSHQKIFKGETKHILREAMRDILPQKIIDRKDKKGFTNPRDKWFRSDQFKVYIFDLINSDKFIKRGYFDSVVANRQYKLHLNEKIDASKEIWKWINLELWFRKYIDEN